MEDVKEQVFEGCLVVRDADLKVLESKVRAALRDPKSRSRLRKALGKPGHRAFLLRHGALGVVEGVLDDAEEQGKQGEQDERKKQV